MPGDAPFVLSMERNVAMLNQLARRIGRLEIEAFGRNRKDLIIRWEGGIVIAKRIGDVWQREEAIRAGAVVRQETP
ncbi:MAG: hypothetical protein LBU64_13895 [Planctomycetota bacterium]|nr:hypothetical protein [Planctomycetota bacterium]